MLMLKGFGATNPTSIIIIQCICLWRIKFNITNIYQHILLKCTTFTVVLYVALCDIQSIV